MDNTNIKYVLSDLANELKEQTKSLIEMGWSLNSFGNLIDGKSIDLNNIKDLQECYNRNASTIESCVLLSDSSTKSVTDVVEVVESKKSDYQTTDEPTKTKLQTVSEEATPPVDSQNMTPETHYCRKCKSSLTANCAENHSWAVIKRKHPAKRQQKRSESFKLKASYKCRRFKKRKPNAALKAQKRGVVVNNIVEKQTTTTETASPPEVDSSFDSAETKLPLTERVVEAFMEICDAVKKLPVTVDSSATTKLAYMRSIIQCPICNIDVTYQNIIEHVICRHDSTKELMLLRCCPFCGETRRTISHLSSHVMWIHVSKR